MQKFLVSKAPYLREADQGHSTKNIMIDLWIGLSPVIIISIIKNVVLVFVKGGYANVYTALYPLITIIVGPLFSLLLEALCLFIMKRSTIHSFKDLMAEVSVGFGAFPGLFIVLCSSPYTPLWVLLVGIAVGEVIGKMVFGGFGNNIFNPALVGVGFIAFTFSDLTGGTYLNAYESAVDAFAGATPLTTFAGISDVTYNNVVAPYGSLLDFFIGTVPGAMGETSAMAIIFGCLYLSLRKVIDYKVPLIYVGTVFLVTMITGFFLGQGLWYPTYNILSGGLLFGAVYMATEPVTSPKTNLGRIMYAAMLGVLTVLFRSVGSMPEGVATAILTMNVFGLIINKYCVKIRIDGKLDKNEIPGLVIYLVIFVLIFVYDIIFTVRG